MKLLSRIISDTELARPDGRPLYRYRLSPETFAALEEALRLEVVSGRTTDLSAPAFVLWAAEHIRARFSGGALSWEFVLDALGLPYDDQVLGRELASRGLSWWGREVRQSDSGIRLFLYSLLAEGGIPEELLKESGLYRNVVMGLVAEIEAEGGSAVEAWAELMALRWRSRLPQTFQSADITRLLAGLALSLVKLRAALPNDLPEAAAEQWLNMHQPGWRSTIPLRMTPQIAESLIRPALRAERDIRPAARPLCGRELRRGENGNWNGYLILHDNGWLPERHFPGAEGLRLRLLPTGATVIQGVAYSATPEEKGWRLRRLGRGGRVAIPLMPDVPFAFAAFADGQTKGEVVVDAGVPKPIEGPSFWRATELSEGATTEQLMPLTGAGRTRGFCIWVLTSQAEKPEISEGLRLDEVESAQNGFLWRVSGRGTLRVGDERYRIETGAEEDAPEARLMAFGETLWGWRLRGNIPVYCGDVDIHGQIGVTRSSKVVGSQIRRVQGHDLCSEIVAWIRGDEVLARLRLVRVPQSLKLRLQEVDAGRIALSASGLDAGWRVTLSSGEHEIFGEVRDGAVSLTLETPQMAPGLVRLRLSELTTGRTLELQAAWPARFGMVIDPNGARLERNQAISVDALQGWRLVTPERMQGDLQFQLSGYRPVSVPIGGEVPIASYLPSIKSMLAQGGADAQVNLSLVVSGREGNRLEIRRYHEIAHVENNVLRMGLDRNEAVKPETALGTALTETRRAIVRGVNLCNLSRIGPVETPGSVNLEDQLKLSGGPWLLQSTLEGKIQRAAIWDPRTPRTVSREERTDTYAEQWRLLVAAPGDSGWDRSWDLISVVGQDGDSGVLDQVQALAKVPVAAVALALRVPAKELSEVFALEAAAPLFWPALAVSDFAGAVMAEHTRQRQILAPYLEDAEATEVADRVLVQRIADIVTLRPELAGHFCSALIGTGVFDRAIRVPEISDSLRTFLLPSPDERLAEAAHEAARRFDRLPQGVRGLEPIDPPIALPSFNAYAQAMIDAPLVVAEMATEQRDAPNPQEKLALINLRLIDPLYFDTALPTSLALYLSDANP